MKCANLDQLLAWFTSQFKASSQWKKNKKRNANEVCLREVVQVDKYRIVHQQIMYNVPYKRRRDYKQETKQVVAVVTFNSAT